MRYLDIANCDMEKGGMRLEANISLRREGKNELPDYKVECKNINSFKFLEAAINFEIDRQTTILQNGKQPIQETRGYNSTTGKTFPQRSKEDAADYRYFPDPDLPPIEFTAEEIEIIRKEIPELPAEKTARFINEYKLNEKSAKNLTINMEKSLFFEEILKEAKKENLDSQKLINNLLNGKIKFESDEKTSSIIAKFKAISNSEKIDEKELQLAIDKVLNAEKDAVAKYKAGKTVVTGFLIGCIMKELGKKADVAQVKQQLIATLS
jgi:aspartyl-tRNA(Asn)/glutamyl-tRNA(Gln) amidotransferase subunit B